MIFYEFNSMASRLRHNPITGCWSLAATIVVGLCKMIS